MILRILKYAINIAAILIVVYSITMLTAITDITCEDFRAAIIRGFKFYIGWFLLLLLIVTIVNFIIEKQIEKADYLNRVLKLSFLHIVVFALCLIINSIVLYNSVC